MAKACAPRGKITYRARKKLPAKAFALPKQRKYPLYRVSGGELLPSKSHAVNAKARAQQEFDQGRLSATALAAIDRKANKVIKECSDMARAKKKVVRRVKLDKSGAAASLTKREITMLRTVDRHAKKGDPWKLKDYSSDSAKALLRDLSKRRYIQIIAPGKGYMVTTQGARAIGNKYKTKTEIKALVFKKPAVSGGKVPTRAKPAKKKAAKKKASKKRTKKVAKKKVAKKKVAKKKVAKKTSKKRTPAQRAALAKARATRARKAEAAAKKAARKAKKNAKKSRAVKARYSKGVHVKVEGSKGRRVPVEVRDVKSIRNRVVVLV